MPMTITAAATMIKQEQSAAFFLFAVGRTRHHVRSGYSHWIWMFTATGELVIEPAVATTP